MKLHHTLLCMQSLLITITDVYGIEKKLLFSTYTYLKEIDLNTMVVRTLVSQNDYVYSMAYDHKERYMYVTRFNTRDIVRFPYPTNHTVMFETVVHTIGPVGIAFDYMNNHVYWTEHATGKIKRCNPDGSNVTVLVNETQPKALTLDIQNRWIYFGQNKSPSKIFRTNFDGMDKREIIKNVSAHVYGIGVDIDDKRLYWMEYDTGDLRSAWLNGSDIRTIVSTNTMNKNWEIQLYEDFIFYTSGNKIMKINKSLGHTPIVVHTDTRDRDILGLLLYKQDGNGCDENE